MQNNMAGLLVLTAVACGDCGDDMRGRDPYRFTNLGSSTDMVGKVTQRVANQTYLEERKTRLLDVSLQRQAPRKVYDAGPWCLTVTSQIVTPSAGGGLFAIIPLVVDIGFGSGGAAHKITLDAVPGFALQVPAATVTVDVRWDSPLPIDNVAAGQWTVPPLVRVRATLQRAQCNPWGHRTFALARDQGGAIQTTGLVPSFARTAMVYSTQGSAVYNAASNLLMYEDTGTATMAQWFGPDLVAMLIAGDNFPVPGAATGWRYTVGVANATPGYVIFDVGL